MHGNTGRYLDTNFESLSKLTARKVSPGLSPSGMSMMKVRPSAVSIVS